MEAYNIKQHFLKLLATIVFPRITAFDKCLYNFPTVALILYCCLIEYH